MKSNGRVISLAGCLGCGASGKWLPAVQRVPVAPGRCRKTEVKLYLGFNADVDVEYAYGGEFTGRIAVFGNCCDLSSPCGK